MYVIKIFCNLNFSTLVCSNDYWNLCIFPIFPFNIYKISSSKTSKLTQDKLFYHDGIYDLSYHHGHGWFFGHVQEAYLLFVLQQNQTFFFLHNALIGAVAILALRKKNEKKHFEIKAKIAVILVVLTHFNSEKLNSIWVK